MCPARQRYTGEDVEDDEQPGVGAGEDEVLEDNGNDHPCWEVRGRYAQIPRSTEIVSVVRPDRGSDDG
jgi:hypothetical protein